MNCSASCVDDAGPVAPRTALPLELASTSINVSVRIDPAVPSVQLDSGHFRYVAMAYNRTGRSLRVVDPAPIGAPPTRAEFWNELTDSVGTRYVGGALSVDESRAIFEAGETKTQVFDFRIGADPIDRKPPPGIHSVRGRFGNQYSDSVVVRLLP